MNFIITTTHNFGEAQDHHIGEIDALKKQNIATLIHSLVQNKS